MSEEQTLDTKTTEPTKKKQRTTNTNELSKSFLGILSNQLGNDTLCDTEFVVGEQGKEVSFKSMRGLFAAQSEVFKSMLFGNMKESRNNNEPVYIRDVTIDAFDFVHKLIHLQTPNLTYNIIADVLKMAQQYLMDTLIKECKSKMIACDDRSDFLLIMKSIKNYPPNTFNPFYNEFISKSLFLSKSDHLLSIISDELFLEFPIFIVQALMKIHTTNDRLKYEKLREYCKQKSETDWKQILIGNFEEHIHEMIPKQKNHICLKSCLLSQGQLWSLKAGDHCDYRRRCGTFHKAAIKSANYAHPIIQFLPNNQNTVPHTCTKFNWQKFFKFGSVTDNQNVQRSCLSHLTEGDQIYVNLRYDSMDEDISGSCVCRTKPFVENDIWEICLVYERIGTAVLIERNEWSYTVCVNAIDECRCTEKRCQDCYKSEI